MKNFPKCKIWKVDDERIQQEKFHGNTCLLSSHSLALSLDPLTQDELRCIAVSLINPNFSHIYFPFPVLCNCENVKLIEKLYCLMKLIIKLWFFLHHCGITINFSSYISSTRVIHSLIESMEKITCCWMSGWIRRSIKDQYTGIIEFLPSISLDSSCSTISIIEADVQKDRWITNY